MKELSPRTALQDNVSDRPHGLRIRTQLLILLLGMAVSILFLVWFLSSNLLQPRYNRFIRDMLTRRLDQTVSRMDEALEKGVELSRRDISGLTVNSDFWGEMNQSLTDGTLVLTDGTLVLTNCCMDISDTTLRSVMYSENLYPCLLHGSSTNVFGHNTSTADRDNALVMRMRNLCFEHTTLPKPPAAAARWW